MSTWISFQTTFIWLCLKRLEWEEGNVWRERRRRHAASVRHGEEEFNRTLATRSRCAHMVRSDAPMLTGRPRGMNRQVKMLGMYIWEKERERILNVLWDEGLFQKRERWNNKWASVISSVVTDTLLIEALQFLVILAVTRAVTNYFFENYDSVYYPPYWKKHTLLSTVQSDLPPISLEHPIRPSSQPSNQTFSTVQSNPTNHPIRPS